MYYGLFQMAVLYWKRRSVPFLFEIVQTRTDRQAIMPNWTIGSCSVRIDGSGRKLTPGKCQIVLNRYRTRRSTQLGVRMGASAYVIFSGTKAEITYHGKNA